jgi:hypothetical protein
VTFAYDRSFFVHAGPMSRHDHMLFYGIYVNGRIAKVRIVAATIGGKAADASQIASTTSSYEHPKPGDVFEAPFDPRYAALYRYGMTARRTVDFAATRPRYGLGRGTFTFDGAWNVLRYDYSPAVLPPHATWGTIVDERAQVLPGYWAVTHETQTYSGTYSIFGGGATVTISVYGFRRFRNLAAAERAIAEAQ